MVKTMLLKRNGGDEPGTDGVFEMVDREDVPPTDLPLAGGD
jgi:hypothetical protein